MASTLERGMVLVVGVLALLGVYAFGSGALSGLLFQAYDRPTVETTPGTVRHVEFHEQGTGAAGQYGASGTTYRVEIVYTYTVDGASYTGTGVYPDGSATFDTREGERDFVKSHQLSATVRVHYRPSAPLHSWLRYRNSRPVGILGSLAVLLVLLPVGLFGLGSVGYAVSPDTFGGDGGD